MSLPSSATLTPSRALTLDVRSRRSERRLGALALLGVGVTGMLLPLPPLSAALFFLVAAAVVVLGLWSQGWLDGADRLTAISWSSDGTWILSSATRKDIPATLSAESRAGSHWLWLRWHTGAGDRSMLLLTGDVLPPELRRLSVRLRLESVCRTDLIGA